MTPPCEPHASSVTTPTTLDDPPCTRRQFLSRGAAVTALAGAMITNEKAIAGRQRQQRRYAGKPTRRGTTHTVPADPALVSLVNRTSFGYTRDLYALATSMGHQAFLEYQLAYQAIDDSAMDAKLAVYDTLTMTPQQIAETYPTSPALPETQLIEATLLRAVYSQRQLYERMVEFWTDHFNIDINDSFVWLLKSTDDRDVIRQYAMTSFPQLLNASARSAAMSEYLDNYDNIRGHAQENYARELMELHTLGVDNGYNQFDVEEVARCFTGWSYVRRTDLPGFPLGTFRFLPTEHDGQQKIVLGNVIPAGGGSSDVPAVLDMLTTHPNTAIFVSRKLCRYFLGYEAPEDVIQTTAQTYMNTGGDIKAMLRVILQPTVLSYLATPKFKRPFHFAVSTLRATLADITIPQLIRNALFVMGQAPFQWPQPDGYPDRIDAWGTSLLTRWQFAASVAGNELSGTVVDLNALLASEGGDAPGQQAFAIDRILTGGQSSPEDIAIVQAFYDQVSGLGAQAVTDTFGLAASMPKFQWY